MQQYLRLLREVLEKGSDRSDRTGIGTRSLFGQQLRFDLRAGFPLLTTKKLHIKSIIYELLWFLRGDTNVQFLNEHGVSIWNEWANAEGDLGPVYGKQWRSWGAADGRSIDQIQNLMVRLREDPSSRRHLVCAWNVGELEQMALPPCHILFQFYVADGELSCQLYQRSADLFLGVPFNIASYALLTCMVAHQLGLKAKEFIWAGGDVHLYHNHVEQAQIQLQRQPRSLCKLNFSRMPASLMDYEFEDFHFLGYEPHPHIKAEVAV